MDYRDIEMGGFPVAEMPGDQPPAPSYPEKPREQSPLNPRPNVPGTDAPEVSTGSGMDDEKPAEDMDDREVGEIESQNP